MSNHPCWPLQTFSGFSNAVMLTDSADFQEKLAEILKGAPFLRYSAEYQITFTSKTFQEGRN